MWSDKYVQFYKLTHINIGTHAIVEKCRCVLASVYVDYLQMNLTNLRFQDYFYNFTLI